MNGVDVDMSEVLDLIVKLERAIERPTKERRRLLAAAGSEIESEARGNLADHHDSGETEAGLQREMVGDTRVRIWSPGRGGFFLEFGSPTTGAPVPWLSGPAMRAEESLLEELGKTGDVF